MKKKIIIAQSKFLLNAAIRLHMIPGLWQYCFIAIGEKFHGHFPLLKKLGLRQLSPKAFSQAEQEAFLQEYLQVLGRLAENNGKRLLWWATDISSKNRYLSPLPSLLLNFIHCIQAITATTEKNESLIILSPTLPIIRALRESANEHSWELIVFAWPGAAFVQRVMGRLKNGTRFFAAIVSCCIRSLQARIYYGFPPPSLPKPVYLIKSFFYEGGFTGEEEYKDPFFGYLSSFLKKKLADAGEVITVSACFHKRPICYRQMRFHKKNYVIPIDVFITLNDIAGVSWLVFTSLCKNKFHAGKSVSFIGHNIASLIQESLQSGGDRINLYHVLHRAAAKRIAKTYNLIACAFTFEGNPWERMFISGLSEANPDLPIFGCQHSVVPLAAAGVFVTQAEQIHGIPLPSKILATGTIPQQIINKFSSLSGVRCEVSGALRYDYLYAIETPLRRKNTDFSILVALEGVDEASVLLAYSLKQALLFPKINFSIRTHPVLPLSKLLRIINFSGELPNNVQISKGNSVFKDVENCNAVLYLGTTVALEAILIGRPIIHLNTKHNLLNNDPLYSLIYFKWIIYNDKDIGNTVEEITSLEDDIYDNLKKSAQKYIKNYFNSVNDNMLSVFIPNFKSNEIEY